MTIASTVPNQIFQSEMSRDWECFDRYQKAFERLLNDLRAESSGKTTVVQS